MFCVPIAFRRIISTHYAIHSLKIARNEEKWERTFFIEITTETKRAEEETKN